MKKTIIILVIVNVIVFSICLVQLVHSQVPEKGKFESTSGINLIVGTRVLTTKQNHNLFGNFSQTEIVLSKNRHWEGGIEFFDGYQFHPESGKYAGGALVLKYNFVPDGLNLNFTTAKVVPFVDIDLGGLYTNIGKPDIDKKQNFSLQGGGGLRIYVKKNIFITLEERWWHVCNGNGTIFKNSQTSPNNGINGISTMVSVTMPLPF